MKRRKKIDIPFLSIIIPFYNEGGRIANLSLLFHYLRQKKFSTEVILVNDGSTDESLKLIRKILKQLPPHHFFELISYQMNKGKGFAIKTGMLKAKGDYRLFTDIDFSTPIEEFDNYLPHLKKFDILIGSRKKRGAKLLMHQPKIREKLGKGFTKLSQIFLGLNLLDFTCGFKCFSKKAAEEIFRRQRIDRWGFDSEILFIGKKRGFNIKEMPVTWRDDSNTKVKLPHDIITSLYDLLRIRLNNFKKYYD
ncbi:MAG: glycosyltransferase family 2 protein [Candidatus Daviesbacteria bacterium]|nr:glycosyltransferase family 2 protein [Candidatus Daviesbacteria bacterium]